MQIQSVQNLKKHQQYLILWNLFVMQGYNYIIYICSNTYARISLNRIEGSVLEKVFLTNPQKI